LPDLQRPDGELSSEDLDTVAGGVDNALWSDGVPDR